MLRCVYLLADRLMIVCPMYIVPFFLHVATYIRPIYME